jgi:hypothetical protein
MNLNININKLSTHHTQHDLFTLFVILHALFAYSIDTFLLIYNFIYYLYENYLFDYTNLTHFSILIIIILLFLCKNIGKVHMNDNFTNLSTAILN